MSEYEIEKGIEMPPRGRGRPNKYPWEEMSVGDSFFVPGKTSRLFSSNSRNVVKRTGRKFSMRTIDGGVRVWRVE